MINEVILVGKLEKIEDEREDKRSIVLSVERPFNETDGRKWDRFSCRLWIAIFKKVLLTCKEGDLLAVKGRLVNEDSNYIVMAENVVILNKSNNTISKKV